MERRNRNVPWNSLSLSKSPSCLPSVPSPHPPQKRLQGFLSLCEEQHCALRNRGKGIKWAVGYTNQSSGGEAETGEPIWEWSAYCCILMGLDGRGSPEQRMDLGLASLRQGEEKDPAQGT